MSHEPSTSTPHSNFVAIFDGALETYKHKTKEDLASHPLLPSLQSCASTEAILTVLQEQIPAFRESQNGNGGLTKWVTPTVNVLYSFSGTLGQAVGVPFPSANAIFAGIGVLLLAVKDARTSQRKLIEIFNCIERFFSRLDIYTGITPTMAMRGIFIEIMVEVLTILAIATKHAKRGRLKRFLMKLIGNNDIEDSLGRLDKLTQDEAHVVSAEQLKMTHTVNDGVMGVDNTVKGVEGTVEDVRREVQVLNDKVQNVGERVQIVDGKLEQGNWKLHKDHLIKWLSPSDPSINHNIARDARHNGTAQWFFQGSIFNQWKSTGSFLWVHGNPGSGKSILCSSIVHNIETLCKDGRASMAYFYFDFKDVNKQKRSDLLPSLLIQLSASSDPCCDILSRLYNVHKDGVLKPDDPAMVECLKEMLTVKAQEPTYIIMDAIDECPTTSIPSSRENVLDFVKELVGLHLPNVHICVTSRPEYDIQAILKDLAPRTVSLHDESGQQEDIVNYVTSIVGGVRKWRQEDKDLVIKVLSEKANGMFRWVSCQLEVLRHCLLPSIRPTLEELPEGLDETYERILMKIKRPNKIHSLRLMQCLVAASRPLQVKELAEVLAFDFNAEGIPRLNASWRCEDQEEAVMSACSSLVTIIQDGDSRVVQFSHFTVKEYLTANRLADPIRPAPFYRIQLEDAHLILVRACLGLLLGLDDKVDRDNIEDFPLARYAAQYWATHARFVSSSLIKDEMERLFDTDKPYFATWLWIYDDDSVSSTSSMRPEKPKATPLYHAARLGFYDLAKYLIAKHPEHVNARGGIEITPMHVAASAGYPDILSLLLEYGAKVDGLGIRGHTPLHRAAYGGNPEAGRRLIDHDADINARSIVEWTPLHCAVDFRRAEFVRMLLERGAEVDAETSSGDTPLHYAAQKDDKEIVKLLQEKGAKVNARDGSGKTPSPQQDTVELLSG